MSILTDLNLATRPFRNRVLPYLTAALLAGAAALLVVVCLIWLKQNSDVNKIQAERINTANTEIARLKGEGEKVQQQLTPEQKAILSASQRLVANKQFGWSRLFADLESVLPGSVSASRIVVNNIYNDGAKIKADLELAVLSRDYASVDTLIRNMQNTGLFQPELRGQDLQKSDRLTYSEFTFRVIYTPNYQPSAASDVAMNTNGGDR